MKPLLKFTPDEAGVYWIKHRSGHCELRRLAARESLYLDNYSVASIRRVEGFTKTEHWTGGAEEPKVYGQKSRRVETPSPR